MPKKASLSKSDQIKVLIANRILDSLALLFIVLAVGLLLALVSYDSADPSLNTARSVQGGLDIHNWLSLPGSYIADFLLQSIGLAAFLLIPVCAAWAWKIRHRARIGKKALRVLSLLLSLSLASALFALIPNQGDWLPTPSYGGASGTLISNTISGLGLMSIGSWIEIVIWGALGLGSLASLIWATSIPAMSWWKGTKFLAVHAYVGACWLRAKLADVLNWLYHYGSHPLERNVGPKKIGKKKERVAPTVSLSDPERDVPADLMAPAEEPKASGDIPIVKDKQTPQTTKNKGGSLFARSEDLDWELPPLALLKDMPKSAQKGLDEQSLQKNAAMLTQVLEDFKVDGDIVKVHPGPVVTLYELEPAPGTKSSRVIGLSDDIARSMAAVSVRAAVVPGQNVIGIELPNKEREIVYLRDTFESKEYASPKIKLPLVLGKDIGGQDIVADLAKMPHLLIAGTTGSGKSVAINTMLLSLLYRLSPEQCRLVLIDPKMLELSVYDEIPHLLSPVVTEPGRAIVALKWLVSEMENRYRAMSKLGVRNIEGYNQRVRDALKKGDVLTRKVQTGFDPETGKPVFEDQPMDMNELPYIVVVVDEFADLMLVAGKDVENAIQRLAQMARAAGIHIIMATQRPSVDVITGVIKANFPTRISFAVTSKIDSRTILGEGGAEQLLGMGDMLYMSAGGRIKRVHGPFVADEEVEAVVNHLKEQGEPDYIDIFTESGDMAGDGAGLFGAFGGDSDGEQVDEFYDKAVALVAREQKASTSFIQRHFQIGYNRAARIVEEMEKQGVVGPANHVGKREILIGSHDADTGT